MSFNLFTRPSLQWRFVYLGHRNEGDYGPHHPTDQSRTRPRRNPLRQAVFGLNYSADGDSAKKSAANLIHRRISIFAIVISIFALVIARRTKMLRMHAYLYGKDLIVMIWFGYLLLFASFSIISFLNAFKCNVIALGIHGQRNSDFYVATKCDFFFQDLNISGKIFKINFLP